MTIDEGIVIWYSKENVYLERKNISVIDKMHSSILKLRKKLNPEDRISKCFKENIIEHSIKNQEITHLIFVIHGIAQKVNREKIFKDCEK